MLGLCIIEQLVFLHRRVLSWSWWAVLLFVAFTPLQSYSCAKYVHIFLLKSHQRLGKTEIKLPWKNIVVGFAADSRLVTLIVQML